MKISVLFSSLFFAILTVNSEAQIPNSGFEDWQTDQSGNNNPVGWETTNSFPIINVEQYTPGYQGNYAMTVKTVNIGFNLPGIAYVENAYVFTERPSHFFAHLKSNIMPGDQAFILFALMQGDSAVAALDSCTFKIDSTINQFTYIEFPIAYLNNLLPDSLIVMIASGLLSGQVGTELTVDEIGFTYGFTDVSQVEEYPKDFYLFQNYPNPFNPSTTIKYSIPSSEFVTLKVFDLIGNEVATLVNEDKPAGNYEAKFNAVELSSGIYFYTLKAGNFIETRKMILLK